MSKFLVAVAALLAAALLASGAAVAHVNVSPRLLESGEETALRVELPRLRPGAPPTDLAVLGAGVRQLSVEAAGLVGVESRWRVRVRVDSAPGPVTLLLRAGFRDGESVVVRYAVTVVPARADGGSSAALLVGVGAATVAAVGGLAVLFLRTRRG